MYHITIKDLETGKILFDHDSDSILGSASIPENNSTAKLVLADCDSNQLINSIIQAHSAAESATKHISGEEDTNATDTDPTEN